MRTILFTLLMVIAGTLAAPAQQKHKLTINVEDIQVIKGSVLVAVCDKDNFMRGSVKSGIASVNGNKVTVEIADLPAGDYAVMLFHDENGNYQVDMDESGIPTEGVGFSGADLLVGIPTFEECKFTVSESLSLTIKLQYF